MNDLEKALSDTSDVALDNYLEIEPTKNIRHDIEEMVNKAKLSTSGGVLKDKILKVLNEID